MGRTAARIAARIAAKKKIQDAIDAKIKLPNVYEKDKYTIEICIHCFRYQHRLSWMLSSILQQVGSDIPNIIVNISHTDDDGNPTTNEVCEFFRTQGLNIKQTFILPDKVSDRGSARNIQVAETTADWIIFADCDMVYHKEFFSDLHSQLKGPLKVVDKVMGADRVSLSIPFCIKYFEEDNTKYPCVITGASDIASKFPVYMVTGRHTAPGNFQLASVNAIRNKHDCYANRKMDKWRRTKSDRRFRVLMGGVVSIRTKPQYHLNHDRGGPDIQR